MLTRAELFELAAKPIGDRQLTQHEARGREGRAAAKRASKVWLPEGKRSANTNAARAAEAEIKARNFNIEDAIVAAGGYRGSNFPRA